jgi:Tol biopolymer transport system component/DNA-binding winged helix-turn-helix (wHTH) protein
MLQNTKMPSRVTFGLFEADLNSGELRKATNRIKLQALPFKVLSVLLENAGEVVTREELRLQVWGPDIVVEFEHSLSNAVKKIREALGDSAENPRFIETLSRRGFRFIAPVDFTNVHSGSVAEGTVTSAALSDAEIESAASIAESTTAPTSRIRSRSRYWMPAFFFGLGGILVGSGFLVRNAFRPAAILPHIFQITQNGAIYSPANDLLDILSPFVSDGSRLFTPSSENGKVMLSQISISTGISQAMPLLSQIESPGIEDISTDGFKLLVKSNVTSPVQQPLWVVTIDGGAAFRVSNVLALDATWMPDGKSILYTSENRIAVVSLDDGTSTEIATVAGRAFWPRWSPNGNVLRFTVIDPVTHTSSLWELAKGQHIPHPILKTWSNVEHECCGIWTADAKYFVFEATKDGYTDLWKVDASLNSSPIRITNGPLTYQAPAPAHQGEQIFFVGKDVHSLLEQYDSERKLYVPQQGFLADARRIRFSRDGRWVAWVDFNYNLWRARLDGTDRILLTPPSMRVLVANWSPDNTRMAVMARETERPWQIYMVNANGGPLQRLSLENRNIGDPSFSPDGKYLAFGRVGGATNLDKLPRSIGIMDLATHRVTEIAKSEGLFSPSWSPDGRYIAAITMDQEAVMLYDTNTMKWKTLAVTPTAWPIWSRDSKALYIYARSAENKPIFRVSVPSGQKVKVADFNNFRGDNITRAEFAGLSLEDAPLMHTEISSANLYSMDLAQK